ncbi:MAG: hypothetical protein JWP47_2875 [Polaromonas sp.]|nr:hypothetical protein [Polaromonas sp.]
MSMDPRTSSIDTFKALPARRLRWLASGARLLLWLVVSFWLLFGATWGLLHGWIVPRIEEFRPRLEHQASKALGTRVRIGQITARSVGLIPSFELRDVQLLDGQGREALRLPRLLVALSPASVWGLGFEQVVVDRPALEIRRASDGRIFVGGLDMSQPRGEGNAAADWFFSQAEFAIRGGSVRWTDEFRQVPALELADVDAVMRNGRRSHLMRLDATPPPAWGDRFSLRGIFRQPLLSTDAGRWQDWSGQVYAEFSRVDASRVGPYADFSSLHLELNAGLGPMRAWADLKTGEVTSATADVALLDVNARLGERLEPLMLDTLAGRFDLRRLPDGLGFTTEQLDFKTRQGLQWPGGNVSVLHHEASGTSPQKTELKADRLDLAALAQIANRLPLGASSHALIASYAPKGLVENVQARWQGPAQAPETFSARGRVTGLDIAALPAQSVAAGTASHLVGRPGVSGATVDFDMTQAGGKASVSIANGALVLPGVFEEPRIAFDSLSADTQWKRVDGKTDVQLHNISFSNADAQGTAQANWHTQTPSHAVPPKAGAWPQAAAPVSALGVLDLQGNLSRGTGSRVHRYLPLVLPATVRHYVRDAVLKGDLSDVRFKVKGPVDRMPFARPADGDFRISAKVKEGLFAYVPKSLLPPGAPLWPALSELDGELVFDRTSLEVNGASARFAGTPALAALQVVKADARIPDLLHAATVEVSAALKGPAASALAFVNTSPLAAITGGTLQNAVATGQADHALKLAIPLSAPEKSRVLGTVTLPGNDLQVTPALPPLAGLKGTAAFNENGLTLASGQGRFLGGDVRFEGGLPPGARDKAAATGEGPVFRVQGTLTAEGLRQIRDESKAAGFALRLAKNASGSAAYDASVAIRRGMADIAVSSNLQGMRLDLPAPLNKTADSILPIRFEQSLVPPSLAPGQRLQDRISVTLGALASVEYLRDVADAEARVLRGAIGVGLEAGESMPLPDSGVAANINLAKVDLDEWEKVLSLPVTHPNARTPAAEPVPAAAGTLRSSSGAAPSSVSEYLPNRMAIRARELVVAGYKLNQVVVGGTRDGINWRANIDAEELNGYLEFTQSRGAGAGRVFARLSRLSLAQGTASEVESLLAEQPSSIPALDIVVDDLELRGRKLGRIEIAAVNGGAQALARDGGVREWRLNKFNVTLPEAVLTATGNWAAGGAPASTTAAGDRPAPPSGQRRTVMNFKLDIADSGELLTRFGMKDVIRRGKGKMEGQVAWTGSPLSFDYPSMNGQFNINMESGQFLKAEPGIAKLLGVLSLQALPRRLTLDFRDVFSAGFAFDFVRGDVNIKDGLAATNNLQMKGVNAAVLLEGSADLARETQDIKVVVVPEINAGTASLIATVINPAIGLGTFLAQYFLRQPLIRANTQEFHIDGSWADPRITKVERKP